MKKSIFFVSILTLFIRCAESIKNENTTVIQEEGTESSLKTETSTETNSLKTNSTVSNTEPISENNLIGFWVGYFEKDLDKNDDNEKNVYADEGFMWTRENKINISIDKIEGEKVRGHSVVAGNNRPFSGTMKKENEIFYFELKEPGDNKYDGAFTFQINYPVLEGTWQAFRKIDISKRKYKLQQKVFKYDPDIMLEQNGRFINWEKSTKGDTVRYDEEYYEIAKEFSSATSIIYEINASNKLLTKKDVENLTKGDILVIRNAIYARHGYSFKNRPLRVFFDAQSWYIPVFANIKNDFTEIEVKNIEFLLRYEKNAKEYYDRFGRG
jgi:hypothetical protein